MVKYVESGTGYSHSVGYEYNADNNLTSLVETINGTDYTTSYTYDDDNRVTSMTTNGTTVEYTYDDYGRVTTQVTKRGDTTILTETFTYVNPSETTTSSQVATNTTVATNYTVTYAYTYDDNGNILSVTESKNTAGTEQEYVTTYVYDSANQLIRENNQRRNRSYTWAYDNAGNVLSEKTYAYTTGDLSAATPTVNNSYTYGDGAWGDLLTAYNGTAITYDEVGNPNGYNDRTFTWEHGRQLATQTKGGVEWEYTYNNAGLRTKRSSDSKTYEYVYSGDKLVQMTITDHTTNPETVQFMEFSYDAAGQPLTMTQDGTLYYYVLNIQGDVTGLIDGDGNLLICYLYEGFGEGYYTADTSNQTAALASTNPLGYRGYVLDIGTAMYYLQSRYYDPTLGRFLNADALASTGQGLLSNNMFAYCGNNPVSRSDAAGCCWRGLKDFWDGIKQDLRKLLHNGHKAFVDMGFDTAGIGASILGMYESSPGVYHTSPDCWQQYGGYNSVYDFLFDAFTSMSAASFPFEYNNTEYIIWVWKGDYVNLGAGAELGIYYGGGPHWLVDTELAMPMFMQLSYHGTTIISHSQNTWWINGFNSNFPGVQAGCLSATFVIIFPNEDMYNAFAGVWNGKSGWTCNPNNYSATLHF